MLLGDLIARFDDEAVASETLLRLGDLRLVAAMRAGAEETGLTLGAYARVIIRHYADTAPDDEWTQLMGLLSRAEDPGAACLMRAFAYTLAEEPKEAR
ncbi:MAG: hypothetical protein KDJ86_01115 [Bauldia sp.]|uniref:hypothetical protein n=1 Tax=Bauldia sp. TaxID=2575872 RepID=UPI001DF33EAF|nr:hypothetical protein [Bauldia sp.]MCB1494358.1 hypothetical protein [Bauldia sp.]